METLRRKKRLTLSRRIGIAGAFCMLLLPIVVVADSCAYEEKLNFVLPAAGITALDVEAGAGALLISGRADVKEITVSARLCASRKKDLDKLSVAHSVQGGEQHIWTQIPTPRMTFWSNNPVFIDLQIVLPEGLAMTVKDGSGPLTISGASELELHDGSGDAHVFNIAGNVRIDDGSGSLIIEDVRGSVDVDDGSGATQIARITGDVRIDDGSGALRIEDVQGSVDVDDGSGAIYINRVQGVVTTIDGSGDIEVRDVGPGLNIIESGSGEVLLSTPTH